LGRRCLQFSVYWTLREIHPHTKKSRDQKSRVLVGASGATKM
jgi:hypothetical protein